MRKKEKALSRLHPQSRLTVQGEIHSRHKDKDSDGNLVMYLHTLSRSIIHSFGNAHSTDCYIVLQSHTEVGILVCWDCPGSAVRASTAFWGLSLNQKLQFLKAGKWTHVVFSMYAVHMPAELPLPSASWFITCCRVLVSAAIQSSVTPG